MALQRRNPFSALRSFEDRLNKLFPSLEDGGSTESAVTSWTPRVDVYEQGNDIVFELEAPGVSKDEIDVSLEDNRLTIRGERREDSSVDERDYYRSERFYGSFQRSFSLPERVDRNQIQAEFDDGVLTVRLPKAAEARKKSIDIQ